MSNLVNISVDGYENWDIFGKLYTAYSAEPTSFTGIVSLLFEMERFYDRLGFPMDATEHRRFNGKNTEREKMIVMEKNNPFKRNGEKASFIIFVHYRQNSSWQGTMRWLEKDKEVPFRSALELIRLIDSSSLKAIHGEDGWDEE
jgi:hypothetical protein